MITYLIQLSLENINSKKNDDILTISAVKIIPKNKDKEINNENFSIHFNKLIINQNQKVYKPPTIYISLI